MIVFIVRWRRQQIPVPRLRNDTIFLFKYEMLMITSNQ